MHFLEGLLDDMPYGVRTTSSTMPCATRTCRSASGGRVNHTQNAFFKECFLDEVAHAAGQDPYQYRRRLLSAEAKELTVLDTAAQKAGWGDAAAAGVFRGIALHESYGSHCAQVAEVSVSANGEVRVHRVVCRHRSRVRRQSRLPSRCRPKAPSCTV